MKNNYASWDLKVLDHNSFSKLSLLAQMEYLVAFGHLASSTHNTQPWAFHFSENEQLIEVYLDNDRVLPASDVIGRQACVSLGCAIGNIVTVAQRYGVFDSVIYHSNDIRVKNRYILLAQIQLVTKGHPLEALAPIVNSIITRRVERRRHDGTADFETSFYTSLTKLLTREEGIGYRIWHRGDPRIKIVAELQSQADSFVANSAKFSLELSEWLLPSDTTKFVGMPGSTFNLSPTQTLEVIEGLKDLKKIHADTLSGFSQTGKKGIESAAFVAMLTVQKQTVDSWVKIGSQLAGVANMVEANNGSLAIHAGLAEVALVRMSLAAMGMTKDQPVILFRAGIRDPLGKRLPHAPRLSLAQVII
jgi:nitroreductase